ncbi:MAG TPA: transglutaminase domain-containing protein, partial [Gemmataceae bacterium]|nr:transglutaminase domain-containing protein [Gemmataceae bacterium]
MGRTLSSYTTGGVRNNQQTITYTVYNQQADPISGVFLTDTLQPGVTFQSASQLPDRNGQELAWSLGTIEGFGRASVQLTVSLDDPIPLRLDSGARAFGTLNASMVIDDAPAAVLRPGSIDPDLLASTPNANTADPFVQEKAAELDYDPQRIFDYLNTEVGYESYTGSLRGARGTLWSAAGNSLDEASLGVALFRASGIPARYAHGTLSDPLSQQLILSMFPTSFQTVGYIPPGTPTADPANDSQLLAETRDHYWIQFDTGNGFQNADTSGLPGGGIGTAFTTTADTFAEVADGLRHKVEVKQDAETYTQFAAALGVGDGLSTATVLDLTFRTVDLVGHPLTVGNFVSTDGIPGLVFTSRTTTYTPYLIVGGDSFDPLTDHTITGRPYQEVLTNFPLGSQLVTGLFLTVTVRSADGAVQVYSRPLADRVGIAARLGGA